MSNSRGRTRRRRPFLSREPPRPVFCTVCNAVHDDPHVGCSVGHMHELSAAYVSMFLVVDIMTDEEDYESSVDG